MRVLLLYLILIQPGLLPASTDSLYMAAISSYEEGRYEQSLQQFREVLSRGVESPLLYYNAGNAAYRSNHLGYSILYYEKALKLAPGFEEAKVNLNFVNQFRSDRFEEVPEMFVRKWIRTLVRSLPERAWAMISLVLFFLILLGTSIYIFARRIGFKKAGFFSALVALIFFTISILSTVAQHRNILRSESGIILAPSVIVKSSPSESGNDLFILHEGTKIVIEDEVSDWWSIRIIDGRTGWIPSEAFLSI